MLFVKINSRGEAVAVTSEYPKDPAWQSRWDWKSYGCVEKIADELNRCEGKIKYVAVDNGECVSPRYDVAEIPAVGDKVSYSFNGDSYPDGTVVKVGASLRVIVTSTGNRYYRRGKRAAWVKAGGTWSLISGWVSEWNREF